jgi:chemosensory pili system protein ChpA (sensor histidine kinase/response regulator)
MMNPNNTVEYNSLSWVKSQLDDVLTDAQSNLSDYIENKANENLENCIEHLQLIYGTLQMVEVYGASMLAEEMKYTATALLEGKVENVHDVYDVLMRAMLQLPDYLEGVQAGKMDAPITLMPLINDLRVVRKECLLTEGVLFSPDIENTVIPSDEYALGSIEPGKLQSEVKRLRTHFQIGLLDYIKNNKERMGLQRMKAVVNSLEKVTSHSEVRNIWMIVSALIDGLKGRGIEKSVSVQTLLSGVDRQLKLVLNVGEDEYLNHYSKDLVKNALYYIGLCTTESDSLSAIKKVYKLDDLMPQEANESAPVSGGLNADLFDTVSKGISEDLAQVKDVLELFMHSSEKELERLVPVAEKLGKIADTYGMLGMGATRLLIMEQKNVLEKIINGEVEASEPVVLEVASGLLNAEAELKDYIADRSGFVDMNKENDVKSVPASEYRQVIFTVVAEAMKNFSAAQEAILSYVSGAGDKNQLNVVLNSLEEVRGVAMMLPLGRVCAQIEKLQSYIRVVLLNHKHKHKVTDSEQDTVADVVTSIEYYFEALSEGRPGVEQGLNSGDAAVERLEEITQSYLTELDDAPVETDSPIEAEIDKGTTADNVVIAFDENSVDTVVDEQSKVETEESAEEDVAQDNVEQQSVKYKILADDADEEIVEIFIEEAVEVLGVLHEYLPQWQSDSENEEALAVIRRGFHTLKGSGRLLGAEMIGEFSWKFENMLNSFIDNKITVSDSMHQALDEALAVLPQLIEQLKGNREPIENIESLMSAADAISDGHNVATEQAETIEETVESRTLEIGEDQVEILELDVVGENSVSDVSESDVVEVIKFDDVVIGDDSDVDISELDADNNFSLEENQDESVGSEEEIIESETELLLDTDEHGEASVENLAESEVIEELVTLDVNDTLEDDFEIDLDVTSETDVDNDTNVVGIVADDGIALESITDNDVVEELVSIDTTDAVKDDYEIELDLNDEADVIKNELSDEDTVEIGNGSDVVNLFVEDEYDEIAVAVGGLADSELDEEPVSLDTENIVEDEIDSIPDSSDEIELVSLDAAEMTDDFEVLSEINIESDELLEEELSDEDSDVTDAEEIEVLADEDEDNDVEVILADESSDFTMSDDELQIDPMLLTIYHDESISHLSDIGQRLDECNAGQHLLQADKVLLRAFHTLYGSARTAEVESIADLAGVTEKYVKARQDSGDENIPDDIALVIREVEQSVANMLEKVAEGKVPASNDLLHEKLNKIVQQEVQSQLQSSLEEVTADEAVDEQQTGVEDPTSLGDDLDVIKVVELDEAEEQEESEIEDVEPQLEAAETSYADIDDELLGIFLEEADELIEDCELTLTEIRQQPNSTEHIQQLQRNMHTLKGGARMADISAVGDLTHNLESLVVMVTENKLSVDDVWFGLLQESLDVLTALLSSVKKRHPLDSVEDLNSRIESLMSGDVHEKRHVERFDIELDDLESVDDEDFERIDISETAESQSAVENKSDDRDSGENEPQQVVSDEKKPHWGERASDVNYKDTQEQVRVRSDLLNDLVDYAGEVNIYHARMGKQVTDFGFNLSELSQTVVRLKEQLRNLEIETEIQIRSGYEKESDNFDDNFDPLEMDQYSTLQQLTRSLSETAGDVESINKILAEIMRDSETLLVQESRISSELQEGLMRTRMVRFGGLSSRLRRVVRQVARELDKEVEIDIDGENSEVERTVLDRIIAPLEHMLRNAVAHGIEAPDARRVLGKSEKGKILINVARQGTDIVIKVKDDGAGIDANKIRQKAIGCDLLTEDSKLSDRDVLQFILHSGFSTADEVTQVAGRGVGMDVVDSEIKQLGGVLDIDTVQGKGTEFTVRLPLTLAINQALLVSAADDIYAVPLSSIEGVVRITGLELQRFYDSENSHYEFNGVEYELKHLGCLLTGNQSDYSKQLQLFPVLLVSVGDQHFALHVEDLLGRREIVVKPVGMQVGSVHGIAGASILADGRVVLILEMSALVVVDSLFKSTVVTEVIESPIVDEAKMIMVVDDSITIRKITERMLKRYGVEVILAKDGVDATNQLQDRTPDLMLLDIEMPRMDGFEVASYVRNDERLKDVPIVMITSRTGSKHKEKAMEIGVNRYLGKPFQEDELIRNINEILDTSFSLK